jgi:hypothetical protein
MRCFTVTRGCARRFRVLKVIEKYGWEPTFVCDTAEQKHDLIACGVGRNDIVISDVLPGSGIQGVSLARDFVCRRLMPKEEWCVWIDDNVEKVTGLRPELSCDQIDFDTPPGYQPSSRMLSLPRTPPSWRQEFEHVLGHDELDVYICQTIDRAEQLGTIFCAFANETNYFFRRNKWQDFGYCRTQLALYKNDGSTWMPFDTMMLEDLYKSADVVARYGSVVVNRHVKPIKPMFEEGGIGSFKRRLPWLKENCRRIMALYPGLLKYSGNGKVYGLNATDYHLTFAHRSFRTVDKWRRDNGYLED